MEKSKYSFSGRIDPYRYINGRRTNQYQFDFNKKIGTLKSANLAIGTSLKSKKKEDKPYESNKGSKEELYLVNANSDMYIDFNIPWTIGIDYKIDYARSITEELDTNYITQSIGLRGDFSITKNWKVSYMTNYDFIRKDLVLHLLTLQEIYIVGK